MASDDPWRALLAGLAIRAKAFWEDFQENGLRWEPHPDRTYAVGRLLDIKSAG